MTQILELRQKRAKAWDAAKAFLDSHRDSNGTVSVEDAATYDKMEAEVVALGHEIDRLERQAAIDREMNQTVGTPIVDKPQPVKPDTADEKTGRASAIYNKAFWAVNRTKGAILPEFTNALQIGTDAEGGYLCPDEFENTLVQALEQETIIRSHAHVFTTSSGSHKIPVVTSKGSASWVDEEGQIPDSDDVFGQKLIGAHKVATRIKVSEELLNDSAFDLEGYFVSEFGRRIGNKEEEAFFTGNGSGKPTGILDGTAGADIGVTTTSASAITADEIIDLFYSLNVPYRKDAIWILNDSTLKAVRKLKDGTGQYLWQPALHEGSFDTLLGKRIFVSPYMPEIASGAKTVAFGDFKFYWIGDRQGITFRRLNELYAENGQVGFIASKRVDGKLILPEAIKVLKQKT